MLEDTNNDEVKTAIVEDKKSRKGKYSQETQGRSSCKIRNIKTFEEAKMYFCRLKSYIKTVH
jgi:hypothetical protein